MLRCNYKDFAIIWKLLLVALCNLYKIPFVRHLWRKFMNHHYLSVRDLQSAVLCMVGSILYYSIYINIYYSIMYNYRVTIIYIIVYMRLYRMYRYTNNPPTSTSTKYFNNAMMAFVQLNGDVTMVK